jgi:lysocardiolipin and lysophospholipid acyltransferase
MFCFLAVWGDLSQATLRNVPILGWGMRQFEFLFLERSWLLDKENIYK